MYSIEIYEAGVYSYEKKYTYSVAKWRIIELGNAAHEKLLSNKTPDLRVFLSNDEYAIIGRHENVWFSARIKEE